jgi:hypothetical protein
MSKTLIALLLGLAPASPAVAAGSVPLPEPSALFLLAIGRKFSSKRPHD